MAASNAVKKLDSIGDAPAEDLTRAESIMLQRIREKVRGLRYGHVTIYFLAGAPRRIECVESELIE